MDIWNIVLAGGEGTRLRPLTRLLHADDRPKQFAVLTGERSLLQQTLDRMAGLARGGRTLVVVGEGRAALAHEQLRGRAGVEIVRQPRNVGTAPGILLPLAHVLARAPEATVVVTPSDHHFSRPERFTGKLPYAAVAAGAAPTGVCLVGVGADEPSTELGWVVPGAPLPGCPGASAVEAFVEKPGRAAAEDLLERGALWNTFVLVGRARALWALAAAALPRMALGFERLLDAGGLAGDARAVRRLYEDLAPADFCADVLARARPGGLAVVAVEGSGWSDWGTPARLRRSLAGSPALAALERRLRGEARADVAAGRSAA
jgi:mannose-1-phosphate guanylyltransferase